jgi:hypothetical protein
MGGETVCSRFHGQVARIPDRMAMRHRGEDGQWKDITWAGYGQAVREVALGLASLGVQPGDAVAVLSRNRPEWHIADIGGMCAGAITVPVYVSNSPSQVAYVAGHSESKVIFVENHDQLLKVEKERDELPGLEHAVIFDGESSADGFVVAWDELRANGRAHDAEHPGEFDERWQAPEPSDLATIVYTSGTTGPPKGTMLTHSNIVWTADSLLQVFHDDENGRRLSYLPLAHIAERITSHMTQIMIGSQTWFAESLDTLVRDLVDCKPNVFFAVPRVYEKMHAGILAKLAERDEATRQMAEGLMEIAKAVVEIRQAGEEIAPDMGHSLEMAEEMQGLAADLLPLATPLFEYMHSRYLGFFIEQDVVGHMETDLEEGELDLAVVIQPIRHPVLETLPLLEEELLLAVPRDHSLASGSRRVPLAQLRSEPFVMLREGTYDLRDQTLSACRRAGFEPYVALDGGEMDSMLRFVAAGIGLAILPEMVVAELDADEGPVALRRLLPRLSRSKALI